MPKLRTFTIAAALAAVTAFPASALTLQDKSILSGSDSGELTAQGGFGFDWDHTPFTAYFDFTVDSRFDLSLTNYSANNTATTREVSGYTLDRFGDSFEGSFERLTTDTSNCENAAGPISGTCNMVGETGNAVAKPGDVLFSNLSAGNYRLGFYDSEEPSAGYAEFNVAPVPLPAGGALLLGALGGFAAFKRRKKSA